MSKEVDIEVNVAIKDGFNWGYNNAKSDLCKIVQQYRELAVKNHKESKLEEVAIRNYWDGFLDCANAIMREININNEQQ